MTQVSDQGKIVYECFVGFKVQIKPVRKCQWSFHIALYRLTKENIKIYHIHQTVLLKIIMVSQEEGIEVLSQSFYFLSLQ